MREALEDLGKGGWLRPVGGGIPTGRTGPSGGLDPSLRAIAGG